MPGLKSGAVTIDNLDVTTGGGAGRGANDGNDVATVNLSVLSHANPSFAAGSDVNSLAFDFGTVALNGPAPTFSFDLFNLETAAGFTAGLDLDSITPAGDAAAFSTNLEPFQGAATLAAGAGYGFTASLATATVGAFSTTYTLHFSDENLPGAASLGTMTLTLSGVVEHSPANADFTDDGVVDGADLLAWQRGFGGEGSLSGGDANGDGVVDGADLQIWSEQFGQSGGVTAIPEAASMQLIACALMALAAIQRSTHGR